MLRISLFFIFSCLLICQTPDTATLQGHVTDQTHAPVPGADVTITKSLNGFKRTAQTDSAGDFSFAGLPIGGPYAVNAVKAGLAAPVLPGVTLIGGSTANINLQLDVVGGSTHVTITGVVGAVRTDGPQLGERLDSKQMEETPLLSRRITFLPLLNAANRPAINQGDVFMNQNLFTTNGAGRRQTWFEVDGTTGNDSWGRQTIFTTLPLAALQEMTILENEFSAEYGGSTGSAVNIITKSGTNRFHGDFLELWRPADTSANLSGFTAQNAASGNDFTSDKLNQTAVALSGPIALHTQFFVAGEYSREDKASPIISPVAPGTFVGKYRGWLGFLRIDHQFNDHNSLFFRSNVDAFYDTNPNGTIGGNTLPSVGRIFKRRTYTEELGETSILTANIVNSFRAQFGLASPITQFSPTTYGTQYQVPISAGGTFTTGTSQSALLLNHQYQINDTLSLVRGRQQIRIGADVIRAHTGGNSKEFGGPIYLGQFIYNTCTQSLATCESSAYLGNIANVRSYTQSYGNAMYTTDDTQFAAFAQDDIRVRPDLTINLGLRYELQTFVDSRKNFAPRVGFSYNYKGDGKTVIRGGLGIYYSQIANNAAANWALTGPTGVFNYTATPGQVGFPASVASAPLPAFPAGAPLPLRTLYIRPGQSARLNQFFPTNTLVGYPNQLLSPYSEQWTFGIERRLPGNWVLSADYVGSHTIRINRPLDVDAPSPFVRTQPNQSRTAQAANCTRPYWVWWYAQNGTVCNVNGPTNPQLPYSVITSDVNNGYSFYHALDVNLKHTFRNGLSMLASYTWSHAIDNVDPDIPGQNPNDANFTGRVENASAIFDQRQRLVLSGFYVAPFKINVGGILTMASGLPYNYLTGTNNSGDTGATADRPVIDGTVVGRNVGRGNAIYEFAPFLERVFSLGTERMRLHLRAEAFNVLNHANFVGYSGTYGNGATAGAGFGTHLVGITNQLPARSLQFSARLVF